MPPPVRDAESHSGRVKFLLQLLHEKSITIKGPFNLYNLRGRAAARNLRPSIQLYVRYSGQVAVVEGKRLSSGKKIAQDEKWFNM